ncbi:MAG: prepilin-type N-terminal cleavage/methylation domain-containing protein, partial [Candidatus Sumerlaeia bacterium]|nr:prepilin-type N-terminal cleavage/methylation domain-containing protein [Candidatus Sumerlaeia bacterium]
MKSHYAFTLIELLCVVAMIAILAAIAIPNFLEAQVRSKIARVKQDQAFISAAMEAYFCDYKMYPTLPPMINIPNKKFLTEEEFEDIIARFQAKAEQTKQFMPPPTEETFFKQIDLGDMHNLRYDNAPLYVLLKFFQAKKEA